MPKWVPDSNLDLQLDEIGLADEVCVCNAQPTTFWQAHWPDIWEADTVVVAGDIVHPPTPNGYIYECTVGGTTGSSEPGWGTVDDGTFSDNTVTWKTHTNYSLANSPLDSGDKVIADAVGPDTGRTLTIASKVGIVVHRDGTVTYTALTRLSDTSLKMATTASTTTAGDDNVLSGKAIIINSLKINSPDPV